VPAMRNTSLDKGHNLVTLRRILPPSFGRSFFFFVISALLYLVLLLKEGGYRSLHPHFLHDSFLWVDMSTSEGAFYFFILKLTVFFFFDKGAIFRKEYEVL